MLSVKQADILTHLVFREGVRASIIVGLVFVVVASLLAYFFAPKGENQTYVPPNESFWELSFPPLSPMPSLE